MLSWCASTLLRMVSGVGITTGTTALVHERQMARIDEARRQRLAVPGPRRVRPLPPLRVRAGWFLVDTGLRLTRSAPPA